MNTRTKKEKFFDYVVRIVVALSIVAFIALPLCLYFFHDLKSITVSDIAAAEKIFGLNLTKKERKMMLKDLEERRARFKSIRNIELPNDIFPAFYFSPLLPGREISKEQKPFIYTEPKEVSRPQNLEDLAFYSVVDLACLIKTRKITSTELTKVYLERLKKYGQKLECIITLTEDLALTQAKRADEEILAGNYRGPLHGIPYGAKDLLATKDIPTTWGSAIFKDQLFSYDATVVERLEKAGAVLVAKLTLGELAMGDVWFGGRTRNPWNLEQGSSGSSAGSASAVISGLVGFAIGSETLGSIVSPSTRCGATGLRPTFGRVSRYGAMALSWTMDKIGPICRTVEDCALVLEAIKGQDGKDPTVIDAPFNWNPLEDLKKIRLGYLKSAFESQSQTKKFDLAVLEVLKSLGLELIPVEPPKINATLIRFILEAEAAAAFDEITRKNLDDLMVRQGSNAWPNIFRHSRFIPAVEYIQANRVRWLLMQEMEKQMNGIDVLVTPSYGNNILLITNLTGHPAVVVPSGIDDKGNHVSISFIGSLFNESHALRLAKAYQDASGFHLKRPKLD